MMPELRWVWLGIMLARGADLLVEPAPRGGGFVYTALLWAAAEALLWLARHLRWRR